MNDTTNAPTSTVASTDEKELLRAEAKALGLNPHHMLSAEKLKVLIEEAKGNSNETATEEAIEAVSTQATITPLTEAEERAKVYQEQMQLVRCRIICHDPRKQALGGEIYSVSSDITGLVQKQIPYNEAFYKNGYQIPRILVEMLKSKKFNQRTPTKVMVDTTPVERLNLSPTNLFTIIELPQLTEQELKELAHTQALNRATA